MTRSKIGTGGVQRPRLEAVSLVRRFGTHAARKRIRGCTDA